MAYLLLAVAALVGWVVLRVRRRAARLAYLENFDFAGLLDRRLAKRRPDFGTRERAQVFDALRDWFWVCHQAGRRKVSMPSQAVDDAWHEFILFTRNYQDFCQRALGRFLHHVPAEAMSSPTQATDGLRRSWRLSCRRAGIDPATPAILPPLFALDGELGIGDGFRYQLDCLKAGRTGPGAYCAGHIGCSSCSSGCSTGDSASGGDGGGDGGCGGGCGGD